MTDEFLSQKEVDRLLRGDPDWTPAKHGEMVAKPIVESMNEHDKHLNDIGWWKEIVEEQRRAIVALNSIIAGPHSTTTENLTIIEKYQEHLREARISIQSKQEIINKYEQMVRDLQNLCAMKEQVISKLNPEPCMACGVGQTFLAKDADGLLHRVCNSCGSELAGYWESRYNMLHVKILKNKEYGKLGK